MHLTKRQRAEYDMRTLIVLLTGCMAAATPGAAAGQSGDMASAVNSFAADLYGQARGYEGNLFVSPYSVSAALAMVYAGTGGESAAEMRETLHFPAEPEELPALLAQLDIEIRGKAEESGIVLHTANSLWPSVDAQIRPDYLELLDQTLGAKPVPLDYARETEASRRRINNWVEDHTQDKIQDLLTPSSVTPLTVLVLVNAVYFKAPWETPFDPSLTQKRPFYAAPGKAEDVDTMYRKGRFAYADLPAMQVLRLPYAGGAFTMTLVLPKKPGGLEAIEAGLTLQKLGQWPEACAIGEVIIFLPKFTMTWGTKNLRKALEALGMECVWDPERADFSGIFADEDNCLDGVYHKTFVEVNEEGTEAAAATAATMKRLAMPAERPAVFRADHPFLFYIRCETTVAILFLGRLADPTE